MANEYIVNLTARRARSDLAPTVSDCAGFKHWHRGQIAASSLLSFFKFLNFPSPPGCGQTYHNVRFARAVVLPGVKDARLVRNPH